MQKLVCYTLDMEPDFGGRKNSYYSLKNLDYFKNLILKNKLKLTTFTTANMFRKKKDTIKELIDIRSEIELHSYSHKPHSYDEVSEIKKAKKAYVDFFGKNPLGYRAPKGIISQRGFKTLSEENFKFDSSIYPTIVPGRYNNLGYPTTPFYYKKYSLIEIPFSVIPIIRLPLAMGYLQPLGSLSKPLISIFGLPEIIVFDFHMWNLYKPSNAKLPLKWKLLLARNLDKGFRLFEYLIKKFRNQGYKSVYMYDMYKMCKSKLERNELRVYKK